MVLVKVGTETCRLFYCGFYLFAPQGFAVISHLTSGSGGRGESLPSLFGMEKHQKTERKIVLKSQTINFLRDFAEKQEYVLLNVGLFLTHFNTFTINYIRIMIKHSQNAF